MSMIGELKFFLELQIKQTPQGIYIHQTKYVKELLKKFSHDCGHKNPKNLDVAAESVVTESSFKDCIELLGSNTLWPVGLHQILACGVIYKLCQ